MNIKKNRYKNPISCIYKIVVKNYIYIGSTTIFSKRKYEHFWKLNKNIHPNQILQNVFNKYGEKEFIFSIVEEIEIDKLIETEQKYIDLYINNDNFRLINILTIAGSSLGYVCSEETREKKRISMLGKNKGNKRNVDFCLEQSKRQKGRIITEEWRQKISSSLKGRKSPNKPKRFIEINNKSYSFKDFSEMVNCDISTLYTTKKEYTEKKYNCKIIILHDSEEFPNT
jgi:group I intron endonuclease